MASDNPNKGFPQFSDGDVFLIVSTRKAYKLHSQVLRRVSTYFRDIFDTKPAVKLTAAARRDGHIPWRFVLVQKSGLLSDRGQFVHQKITESGRIQKNIEIRAPANSIGGDDGDKCWDWLFGCFYGIAPIFDNSTFGATISDCFALLDVGDAIGADNHIRGVIELELLRCEVLWKSIASDPTAWAELGQRLRSPTIFKEVVVHIVGKWKMLDSEVKAALPRDMFELCQRKWNELELAKRAIEIRIAGHYPSFLCRNQKDKPHRSAYAGDIYMWMSLSFFRQYLSQSGNDAKNRQAEDGGYAWYKQFSQGGDAYLNHEDMMAFYQYFPMSSKACGVMEANMNVLKEDIKVFVKDLMVVKTHIDPAALPDISKPWLTCTVVEKEDLPWHVEDEQE